MSIQAADLLGNLRKEKQSKLECGQDLVQKIQTLSSKMGVTSRLEIQDENELCSESALKRLDEETKKLLKRKHMKDFMQSLQDELDQLWKSCFASDDDLTDFYDALESFMDDKECIFDHYESSVRYWRNYQNRNSTLLSKINEWIQLMTADKFEKNVEETRIRLPKLTLLIQQLVEEFHVKEKRPFLLKGLSWKDFSQNHQEKKASKCKTKSKLTRPILR